MAEKVPQGPGQAEVIGALSNPHAPNQPGWYKDPESGVVQHVMNPAGADALVRMGWQLLDGGPDPLKEPAKATKFAELNAGATAVGPIQTKQVEDEPADTTSKEDEPSGSDTKTEEPDDEYEEVTLDNGNKRYYKNKTQISEADFKAATGS